MSEYIIRGGYACFWHGIFSQWHMVNIAKTIEGKEIVFNCAEQMMMYEKALLFEDFDTGQRILASASPREQKFLGRKIKSFNSDEWNRIAKKIVYENNLLKFSQHPDLKKILFETCPLILVEASPFDKIWGVGRGLEYPHLDDSSTWLGKNWLGQCLTKARETLMRQDKMNKMKQSPEWDNDRFRIAATGHRPKKLYGYDLHDPRWLDLGRKMRKFLLKSLEDHGKLLCISGMALGVDQLFALVALKLRDQGYDVRVLAALPCRDQNKAWVSDEYWQDIMRRCDEKYYVSDKNYSPECMQKRNEYMVDNADIVFAVWDGSPGGTKNCIDYAQRRNIPVINMLSDSLECSQNYAAPRL